MGGIVCIVAHWDVSGSFEIISTLGDVATSLELVGRKEWKLPDWWPGDTSGGDRIFPDADTAGRQIYRAGYTFVSFFTLGSAFAAYLTASSSTSADMNSDATGFLHTACVATAALSFGASIASLTNASPLGLMPSFEQTQSSSSGDKQTILLSASPGDTLGIRRDDSLKFTARGLTRITRHPLILPVVPWGFATSYLAGNRPCDYILFGGLALYSTQLRVALRKICGWSGRKDRWGPFSSRPTRRRKASD